MNEHVLVHYLLLAVEIDFVFLPFFFRFLPVSFDCISCLLNRLITNLSQRTCSVYSMECSMLHYSTASRADTMWNIFSVSNEYNEYENSMSVSNVLKPKHKTIFSEGPPVLFSVLVLFLLQFCFIIFSFFFPIFFSTLFFVFGFSNMVYGLPGINSLLIRRWWCCFHFHHL